MPRMILFILFVVLSSILIPAGLSGQSEWNRGDLEAFLDGVMTAHLTSLHIPGAVLTVVKDDEIVLAKGYGYADVETGKEVDVESTLFRTGSTGKLFTWTAVMQLFEQGKLVLDADINTYLKEFKIPETFSRPITMNHLLSHTAGFEDRFTGLGAREPEDTVPLGKWLAANMPARVRLPGELAAYSNYGTALAGYIVEVVSGIPYEKYIEEYIFEPLEMTRTTFDQPPGGELAENMSLGYQFRFGWHEAKAFEIFRSMAPAGLVSTTAIDMAKFMIAHLNLGKFADSRILSEETARKMHSRLFSHDPRINGNAHGFWEEEINGLRIIGHAGDTSYFHTLLALIPGKKVGMFVSYNSTGTGRIPRNELLQTFVNRYYPLREISVVKPVSGIERQLRRYTGSYWFTRNAYVTFEKIAGLINAVNVTVNGEGYLVTGNLLGSVIKQWVLVEPLMFRERGGQGKLVFKENNHGQITHMFIGALPQAALEKLSWYESPGLHLGIFLICTLLFLSTLRWPLSLLGRFLNRSEHKEEKRCRRHGLSHFFAGAVSLMFLLFLVGLAVVMGEKMAFVFEVPSLFKILLILPVAAAILTPGAIVYAFLAWRQKYWSFLARIHYTLLTLAFIAFSWFLYYWNFLGFHY